MNVFVLCTGRSGSSTFNRACDHIANYTNGHETLAKTIGKARFEYPENHIEVDNRLSWFLGTLDRLYGQDAYYVHLIRNRADTMKSWSKRWKSPPGSIMPGFARSVLMRPLNRLTGKDRGDITGMYYDAVNDNIRAFLKDKPGQITLQLENIEAGFGDFWEDISARGDLDAALGEFTRRYDRSES